MGPLPFMAVFMAFLQMGGDPNDLLSGMIHPVSMTECPEVVAP